MRYAFRAVVVAGFVLGLLLGFLAFDAVPARAQTETPVPTPEVLPYTWGCRFFPGGAAPVCTWGDYFEIGQDLLRSAGGWDYYPGDDISQVERYAIIPPEGSKTVELACQYEGLAQITGPSCTQLNYDLNTVRGKNVFDAYIGPTPGLPETWTTPVVITVTRSSGLESALPTVSGDYSKYFWFGGSLGAYMSTGCARDGVSVVLHQKMACEVRRIQRVDGSWYKPPSANPPTPTPGPGWEVTPWASDPWVPVADPEPIGLEVSLGETECLTLLPGANFPDVTIGGSTYSLDFPGASVCLEQYSVSLEMLGIDFGVLVVAVVTLGGMGVIYTVFKKG